MDVPRVQPPPVPRSGLAWWHWLLAVGLFLVAGGGFLAWRTLTPVREASALRDALGAAGGLRGDASLQLNVGALPMVVARLGARFLPLPPEACVALRTLRGASLGIYPGTSGVRGAALLEAADRGLTKRGWERVVGVVDGGQVVGVYLPRDLSSHRRIRVAVFVQSREQLVVVTARANLEPLLAWIRQQTGAGGRLLPETALAWD